MEHCPHVFQVVQFELRFVRQFARVLARGLVLAVAFEEELGVVRYAAGAVQFELELGRIGGKIIRQRHAVRRFGQRVELGGQ